MSFKSTWRTYIISIHASNEFISCIVNCKIQSISKLWNMSFQYAKPRIETKLLPDLLRDLVAVCAICNNYKLKLQESLCQDAVYCDWRIRIETIDAHYHTDHLEL